MKIQSYNALFSFDKSPEEVFDAVTNVRGWWSEGLEGASRNSGDEFTYRFEDLHTCKVKLKKVVPYQQVVWQVLDNRFKFTEKREWNGTEIVFDISKKDGKTLLRFTHVGLTPEFECFDICSKGWDTYVKGSLCQLIEKGRGQPNPKK